MEYFTRSETEALISWDGCILILKPVMNVPRKSQYFLMLILKENRQILPTRGLVQHYLPISIWFGLAISLNSISTSYGLYNAEIWFICKCLKVGEKENRERERKGGENVLVWFICLIAYQSLMVYLMLKFDSFAFVWRWERKKSGEREREWFGLVYLFNSISISYGLFNAKI